MAKATVNLICTLCGKGFVHTHVCSNRNDADRYEGWALKNIKVCPDCRRTKRQEEQAQEISKKEKALALAELDGTPKQIDWARKIRYDFLEIVAYKMKLVDLNEAISEINKKTDAVFWIENRIDFESDPRKSYQKVFLRED